MKISFDPVIKLAGIGIVPWNRLGPEQYLPDYAIASLYGWDVSDAAGLPRLVSLADRLGRVPELPKQSTTALFDNPDFQRLLDEELPGYDLLTYRPVKVPPALGGRKVLMTNPVFTDQFENKVVFRRLFGQTLPFPAYQVYDRTELDAGQASFDRVIGAGPKVIQDEQLSGGKGTFLVRDLADYSRAIEALKRQSKHRQVVVSDLIAGARERTIQACVTKQGVFTGPLQRQIVAHPVLANRAVVEGDKFCGAQILATDQHTDVHRQAAAIARTIGQKLAGMGYKGIFGVDFLLGPDDRLYSIEVNPRLTGVTPLLTALFRGEEAIPFYLLHILELGGYPYEITDSQHAFDRDGALLVMHALETYPVQIVSTPESGTYAIKDGQLTAVSRNLDLTRLNRGEFIIQDYMAAGMQIKPGGRILTLQFHQQILDENTDELYNNTIETISAIQRRLVLKPAKE